MKVTWKLNDAPRYSTFGELRACTEFAMRLPGISESDGKECLFVVLGDRQHTDPSHANRVLCWCVETCHLASFPATRRFAGRIVQTDTIVSDMESTDE